ncbi:hypothetical protein V5799_024917 [Amblyomma americanum]|uniref:Uncharacterized protein n=1 Tax=Amblyomma americanum TaxID=6943 RepID=A0AAQ4EAR5_AMBAM
MSEQDWLITQTNWVPGSSDVHITDLQRGAVTFSRFTTDIDQDGRRGCDLVDGPDLGSWSHLLMGLFVVVAVLSSMAAVLAMLDVPFASERAARTPPGYDPAAVFDSGAGSPRLEVSGDETKSADLSAGTMKPAVPAGMASPLPFPFTANRTELPDEVY